MKNLKLALIISIFLFVGGWATYYATTTHSVILLSLLGFIGLVLLIWLMIEAWEHC